MAWKRTTEDMLLRAGFTMPESCPKCGSETACVDTRTIGFRFRRRMCVACRYRYATIELMADELSGFCERIESFKDLSKRLGKVLESEDIDENI